MGQRIKASEVFLAILALMLISVSFYQTWKGLEQIFGGASLAVALVLSLLMLFLCWKLHKAKAEGGTTAGIILTYCFIALFCFVANFNALYTRFMKTDIYTSEIRKINDKYNVLEDDVEARLSYVIDAKSRQDVVRECKLLKIQIEDPKNKGIGTEARAIIARIEKILGKQVTILTPISQTEAGYADLADRMVKQITDMVYTLSPDEKDLRDDIHAAVLKSNSETQKILTESEKVINDMAVGVIDKMLLDYNKLGNRAQNVLGSDKYQFESIKTNAHDVGKIGYAFNHAIDNFGIYQAVVLAGCILLDFVIIIIIMLVTESNTPNGNTDSSIFSERRRSRTLV